MPPGTPYTTSNSGQGARYKLTVPDAGKIVSSRGVRSSFTDAEHVVRGDGGAGSPGAALLESDPERQNVVAAEGAAWEMQSKTGKPIPLDFALALTHLYGEKRDGRYELAALRYLARYIEEAKPSLLDVAGVAAVLAERVAR